MASDKNISRSKPARATKTKREETRKPADTKAGMHPRNRHRGRYDFPDLIEASPELGRFVSANAYGDQSIDFSDAEAVKVLNQALLLRHYGIAEWDIPPGYLCPPIPGRADYLHHAADLLAASHGEDVPKGAGIRVLDIGIGANAVYALLGQREYGWHFVGADIDATALENVSRILERNPGLKARVELRLQPKPQAYFNGIIQSGERFDLTLCNPPFHADTAEAEAGTRRKWENLGKQPRANALNFGGQTAELVCKGGEEAFITAMIAESKRFSTQCLWFTSLISKATTLPAVYQALRSVAPVRVKTVEMAQGQKKSRFVAWSFFNDNQQRAWLLRKESPTP